MKTDSKSLLIIFLVLILLVQPVFSGPVDLPKPGLTDTCPVCGMFVAKYPEWVATVVYKDGHAHHFDGAKDLFKYLLDLPKWAPGHQAENIDSIGVTEYYGLALINAHEAFYVIGSDVLGPMGHELIPLETKEDAEEFLRDHKGLSIIRFNQVVGEMLIKLDNGFFE
ncbi:MAG: nitrous oxide reductase accessory protein NosL [gamma proteobacterium endosymbiont of Lamellibrachia anaximandri]|nr:nitrous oxide reductase accessory protein NosL [gamma proteobacterium endosymbiont of Lamellibrachia anaximandri]MBL3617914.1 nitrous oxide reductase accessory protein NosL [gamma proteobacterium endosymbiont of Lamellibrachia anaximandri]